MKIHLDLDSFFISAERIKKPFLRGIPAAVGGRGDPFIFRKRKECKIDSLKSRGAFVPSIFYDSNGDFKEYFVEKDKIRGIIITASYEARALGIKTGMSVSEALRIAPSLVVLPPNHLYYHSLSEDLREFLCRKIPKIEQFSIDEFFGDLEGWVKKSELPLFLQDLQKDILNRFSLPVSIGAANSKWTAKLATSYAKPAGIKIVYPEETARFIKDIPIESFPGIGKGFAKRLKRLKVEKLGEIEGVKSTLYSWKKPGITLYKRVTGRDGEPVEENRRKKSIGISRTMDPIANRDEIKRRVIILSRYLFHAVKRLDMEPRGFGIKIVYEWGHRSKAHTMENRPFSEHRLKRIALELFAKSDIYPASKIVRLGLRCYDFRSKTVYDLFHLEKDRKYKNLSAFATEARKKYGIDILRWGCEL